MAITNDWDEITRIFKEGEDKVKSIREETQKKMDAIMNKYKNTD